jgi:hypothetical protein
MKIILCSKLSGSYSCIGEMRGQYEMHQTKKIKMTAYPMHIENVPLILMCSQFGTVLTVAYTAYHMVFFNVTVIG